MSEAKRIPHGRGEGHDSSPFICLSAKNNETYGIIGLNLDGVIRFWNLGATNITGYKESEVIGQQICELFFTPEDNQLQVAQRELHKAIQLGHADDQRFHLKKNGERFWGVGAVSQVRDENGRLVGLCKVFQDDTVRRATEEKVISANRELRELASTAAHDLRQPLRTTRQYLQLLDKKLQNVPEESRELLRTALELTGRMDALIGDILSVAEVGQSGEHFELVAFNRVFDLVVSSLKKDILEKQATIVKGILPTVVGLPTELSRLLQNLIYNAIKFRARDRNPLVKVDASLHGEEWLFSVKDNGIGIEPDQLEKIFEMFKRLHSQNEFEGSGLGLSICKKIVEHHGGKIWAESTPGVGSTFFFTIREAAENLEPTRRAS